VLLSGGYEPQYYEPSYGAVDYGGRGYGISPSPSNPLPSRTYIRHSLSRPLARLSTSHTCPFAPISGGYEQEYYEPSYGAVDYGGRGYGIAPTAYHKHPISHYLLLSGGYEQQYYDGGYNGYQPSYGGEAYYDGDGTLIPKPNLNATEPSSPDNPSLTLAPIPTFCPPTQDTVTAISSPTVIIRPAPYLYHLNSSQHTSESYTLQPYETSKLISLISCQ
jgi:hypothetical protein